MYEVDHLAIQLGCHILLVPCISALVVDSEAGSDIASQPVQTDISQ